MKKTLLILAAIVWSIGIAPNRVQAESVNLTPTENAEAADLPVEISIDVVTEDEEMPASPDITIHVLNPDIGLDLTMPPAAGTHPGGALPAAAPPSIDVPNNTPPSIEVPNVEPPSLDVPEMTPPTIEVPSVEPPTVDIPSVASPPAGLP